MHLYQSLLHVTNAELPFKSLKLARLFRGQDREGLAPGIPVEKGGSELAWRLGGHLYNASLLLDRQMRPPVFGLYLTSQVDFRMKPRSCSLAAPPDIRSRADYRRGCSATAPLSARLITGAQQRFQQPRWSSQA